MSQPAPTRQPSQQPVLHHTLHHTLRHAAHYGDSQRPATLTDRTDEADN
ncbi:hypothetical protein JCM19237_4687 [Photobacterium aphoticum]|uniref:Uncharacterized protein n=1 Tax=Photobacterium aphoticum TaxID=754436 RepID=A0A090QUT3_9GAMM|nr:hypothetical protein JCM19237_4687 [Photobacterium aphoticum]